MTFEFKPGSLVTFRDRPWMVLPSEDKDLLLVKPLGGSEDEITGIYKPLTEKDDLPKSYNFIKPSANDLGDFTSAKLLYNATRLSFRNASGPFRCLGKLSFRPRAYQMVPLIMALRQEPVRMLIGDDVGIGKTIEALLIAKELYERKEIKRFAVVCLPHLCDQWQDELKSKFGIEAVIIRSGTATALERQIKVHENIFRSFPFQVISIDYIKTGIKRQVFIDHCPELIIVDEAHTCARPAGANNSQQLRYHLMHDISKNENQNLLLLTATPHSGKQAEFQSLLGILKPEYERLDIISSSEGERRKLAKRFVQRRRADVVKWLGEETRFPERIPTDRDYEVGQEYGEIFNDILSYAREIVFASSGDGRKRRYSYWEALALLRGVMSSPSAGILMLEKKAQKRSLANEFEGSDTDDITYGSETVMDFDYSADDNLPLAVVGKLPLSGDPEARRLLGYAKRLNEVTGIEKDFKAREAVFRIRDYIDRGFNPIVYCRYIPTAKYIGEIFREQFRDKKYKALHIEVITSELNDELRREKIELMNSSSRRLLIATDCLSEGINLQEGFNAILHYDLPWNPNRLEQREGRIDRFGQRSPSVEVTLLYGSNNPIDGVVLEVLLRKAREIRKTIGISVPFPENSASVMEAVTNAILLKPQISINQQGKQLSLFEAKEIYNEKNKVAKAFDEAEKREQASRSIFAQNAIKPTEIEEDLKEVDEAIGDVKAVEQFVVGSLRFIGVQIDEIKEGYKVYTMNIPQRLRDLLTEKNEVLISFLSPTPARYKYIGRNHPFSEQLSQHIINSALNGKSNSAVRTAVLRTRDVDKKTVIFQFRVRNVIAEQRGNKEIVAEEMWLWGYAGALTEENFTGKDEALRLLMSARATQNLELPEQQHWLDLEMEWVRDEKTFREITDPLAFERCEQLVASHTRFRKLVNGSRYKVVEPVLPMDVLGIYILLPEIKKL
ncbi:MAG: DEAD/DEAH box helicase [Bacteroidales bacterium]|nr:DEAD/DEAH box helicase [Bacteroidales bacterium]